MDDIGQWKSESLAWGGYQWSVLWSPIVQVDDVATITGEWWPAVALVFEKNVLKPFYFNF